MMIRKLVSSDYDAMLALYGQLDALHVEARPDYFAHREDVYPRDAFEHNLANPICIDLGAFDDSGKMIAIARATLWNDSGMVKGLKNVCLDNIYVLPAYRRCGIAAALFDQIEAWAREQGAVRLELHTWEFNQGAIAMYRAMGMTPQRYVFEKELLVNDN